MVSNVISRLDTGNSLLAGICNCRKFTNSVTYGCKIMRLQQIQNNAARVVQHAWRHDHIAPVLHQLHWLPVTQRVLYQILTIVFKCLHGLAPVYLTERLQSGVSTNNTKNKLSQSRFSKVRPTLWMTLPKKIRGCQSCPSFKRLLKHIFLS